MQHRQPTAGPVRTQTWLDSLVRFTATVIEKNYTHCPVSIDDALAEMRKSCRTEFVRLRTDYHNPANPDEFRVEANPAYLQPDSTLMTGRGTILTPVAGTTEEYRRLFETQLEFEALAPFLLKHEQATAIRVTPRLLDVFDGATTPHTEQVRELMLQRAWYFDFSQVTQRLAFDLHGTQHFPRAAFINPIMGVSRDVCYWRETPMPCVYLFHDNGHPDEHPGEDFRYWYWRKSYANDAAFPRALQTRVEDLISLLILCFATIPTEHREEVARVDRKKAQRRPARQQFDAMQNASLFRVVIMHPPAHNFGRHLAPAESTPDTTRRLTTRISVRGHFRLVAHGEKRLLRRLQWIRDYKRGPKDAPEAAIPMYQPTPAGA